MIDETPSKTEQKEETGNYGEKKNDFEWSKVNWNCKYKSSEFSSWQSPTSIVSLSRKLLYYA